MWFTCGCRKDPGRDTRRDRFVEPHDREPMFGFSACLTKLQFDLVRNRTDYWAINAEAYSDTCTLWCPRKNFYQCFSEHWLQGRADNIMVEMAYYHYEVPHILNSNSAIDKDGDGAVDHEEFINASAKIPHGFATHYAKDHHQTIQAAKAAGHAVKGSLDVGSLHMNDQMEKDEQATAEVLTLRQGVSKCKEEFPFKRP